MKPEELLATWTELTGEKWRLVPCIVQVEAAEFTKAGFTVEELELVIKYTRRMIDRGEGGLNKQSLLWRVMAADNWQKFQERLELAKASQKRRKSIVIVDRTALPSNEQEIRAEACNGFKSLKEQLSGLSANEVNALPSCDSRKQLPAP